MDSVEAVVIGAGVVGLAVARALAVRGIETLVLERHARIGQETSSRNSGVIHSGIYYPTGSLKARMCVRGRELLYAYSVQRGIDHRRCGKIIVAHDSQVAALQALLRRGIENGVADLAWLTAREVAALEPAVRCAAGLLSPSTGIVDVHQLMLALHGDFEAAAGAVVFNTELREAHTTDGGLVIVAGDSDSATELQCRWLVNCAGLSAAALPGRIRGYPQQRARRSYYAKGNYFTCHGSRPFQRLVYPMPNNAGLGIHATLDLDGTVRFGPDVQWVESPDYSVDPERAESFYAAIREYWPDIPLQSLQPAYAGVRPKLVGPDAPAADFEIEGPAQHAVAGLINLLGIESPGVTSSLALGERVAELISAA
jgi:L-2-hydroxyglutarate oxidase LhgO